MNIYAELDRPLAASTLVSSAREETVKELQEETKRQKAMEDDMKMKLEPGVKRIQALMAALHDEHNVIWEAANLRARFGSQVPLCKSFSLR